MSFSAGSQGSLFSQKKATIYSFFLLVAVSAIVVGVLLVSALHARTVTPSPIWAGASVGNQTYNFTITNSNGGNINIVRITKPTNFVDIYCMFNEPAGGWSCSTNGTRSSVSYVEFTGGSLAAGSTVTLNISSTPSSSAGDYTFTVKTDDDQSGTNSTSVTVSVDTLPPKIDLMNVSDGTRILSSGGHLDGTLFLSNSSGKINIVFNVTDNESGVNRVTLFYNATNVSDSVIMRANNSQSGAYDAALEFSNGSFGPGTLWNLTFDKDNMLNLSNGTRIVFVAIANDTARNGNISNYTSPNSVRVYNFTIDSAAPRFEDVYITNFSTLISNTQGKGINTTKVFGSSVEYIVNSTMLLNVTATASDGGGSGIVRVEVMNGSGVFKDVGIITGGSNGSAVVSNWTAFGMAISNFTRPNFNGDGLYNLSFRITDNVSNVVNANFTIEVDDSPPTGAILSTNISVNGVPSPGNASPTAGSLNLSNITIRLQTTSNIDNITRNVSVFGNKGLVFNLTYESGSAAGTSTWNITLRNGTDTNMSDFCDLADTDTSQCNFRFNFSDILGRHNDSLNLTVVVDTLVPNVSILTPNASLANYSGTLLINVSVNDSVGPLSNVSFRLRNATGTDNGGYQNTGVINFSNVTNWIPMSLNSGGNSQFSSQGYWSFTVNLTGLNLSEGTYRIEINATDSAGRQNASQNATGIIFDSSIPQNITIVTPATNSFNRLNFTIGVNATERASGLLNVSIRLENATHTSPWVGVNQEISALGSLSTGETYRFNFSRFNLTHVGGQAMNMTEGNFTVRLNVTDTAGNQNTTVTINFTIDTVLPGSISFNTPRNNLNQSTNFTVNVSLAESNVNGVWYRWVNDSSGSTIGSHRSDWQAMTAGGGGTFNATFPFMSGINGGNASFLDGNYSIEINVTDSAGNQNSTTFNSGPFVQLVLDHNQPMIGVTGALTRSNQTGNFLVNLTINDTGRSGANGTWSVNLGPHNTTNINASAFRLENATFNGSWVGLSFSTGSMVSAGSMVSTNANRTNATFTFSSVANGLYDIRFMVNDTAGNTNNSVQASNIMLDNIAPGVAITASNLSPAPSGGSGISGTLSINASVTDNLPVNISFGGNTSTQSNTFGVFYRFESATVTTTWLPMSTTSFQSSAAPHDRIVFNASNNTATLADGDYTLRINATDSAGNQNATVTVGITIQNGGQVLQATNETFLEGLWNGMANSSTNTYTFLVNTTGNATCRYSLDNSRIVYNDFGAQTTSNTMTNNVSKEHRISFGSLTDVASGGRTLYYECKGLGTSINYTGPAGADSVSKFRFGIDTRSRYNITIPGKTDNQWPNYFQPAPSGSANGWSRFTLSTLATDASSLATASGGTNVTNVLQSLLQGTAAGNFSRIYAYNASTNTWTTFVVGQTLNTFVNFTGQTEFWINVTATDRIELG